MSILVTGGAGYIGSHTVRALRALDRPVVVLDTLEFGRADAVLDAELVVGDIRDAALVAELCDRHEVTQVVHFAAYKTVGESMEQPGRYWRNNVAGTVDLAEAVLEQGVREFVFSSSCSVNGTPAHVPLREDAPIHPESVYARDEGDHGDASSVGTASPTVCARSTCATSTRPAPARTAASARTGRTRRTSCRW